MCFIRTRIVLTAFLVATFGQVSIGQEKAGSADELIVRAVESYVNAFNKRDAKAVSQHWATDGEFVDGTGRKFVGPDQIQLAFESLFQEMDNNEILSVSLERVTMVTKDVAVEDGVAEIGGSQTKYSAVHKFEKGNWRLHSIRETVIESDKNNSPKNPLADLEWMVGEWVDQSDEAVVRTSYRWSRNRNFLINNFKVEVPNLDPLEGTQVIGFDAARGKIRSWRFDSKGGIGESIWSRKGKDWVVKSKNVNQDGQSETATAIYSRKDEFEFSWTATNRRLEGDKQPDIGPVNVIRLKEPSND